MNDRNFGRADRLAACGLTQGEPAPPYDRITRFARRVLGVATAVFSAMGEEGPWTPARAGPAVLDAATEASLCQYVLQEDTPVVTSGANPQGTDPPVADPPAEAGASSLRFVAGAPVILSDGFRLGALLLFDADPRTLEADALALLQELVGLLGERADQQRQPPARHRTGATTQAEEAPGPAASGPPELIASISENIAKGIFRSAPGQGLVYVNQACVRMFAYDTPEELLQTDPRALYASSNRRDAVVAHLDRAGALDGMALRFQRKDGSTFWGLLSGRVTYDEAGHVQHRDGAVVDITRRKEMEQQLRESEERWQRLVENHPEAVFINVEGRFRYANPAGARLLGVSAPEALTGRSVFDFLKEGDKALIQERQEVLNRGASTTPIEHVIVRPDGTHRIIEVNSVPVTYEGQAAVQTVARDVTERRRAEEQLRAAEAKFRGLVEQSLVGIYIIQDGAFVYSNPALAEILGYSPDALRERIEVQDVVHKDDWPLVRDNLRKRMRGEVKEIEYAFRIRRKDGAVRHVEVHGSRTEHEGAPAVIGTLLDITERKGWERDLIAAKEEAEEMNRLKSAFLANMSHEIRTPLTAIIGFADLIGSSPESAGEFAGLIQRSGQRLLWTLNSVLDLAQLEAGALELTATRIDLTNEVRQMLDEFRPQAQQKSIALCLETPDAPVEGNMDRAAFLRIATNLVSNAVKFTREGHVTVTLRPDGDTVEMRVEDTGIGISEGFLNQIFDEFRQESTGAARTHEGSGLGLTITQRLVDLMGGTIAVDSTPGEGSTFTIRLPRYTEKA